MDTPSFLARMIVEVTSVEQLFELEKTCKRTGACIGPPNNDDKLWGDLEVEWGATSDRINEAIFKTPHAEWTVAHVDLVDWPACFDNLRFGRRVPYKKLVRIPLTRSEVNVIQNACVRAEELGRGDTIGVIMVRQELDTMLTQRAAADEKAGSMLKLRNSTPASAF